MTDRAQLVRRGGLLVLLVGVVYVLLAPAHIVDGDNAEFATLGAVGGRAHPTGYPFYVLYLRALSWLPGASPAHTSALATVLVSTLLVLVLHNACRAWGARPLAAMTATALYAVSPVVLRMHTEAEVFALNGLVVASVLWLAAERGPLSGVARAFGLALVAGLGLANHVTCVLVAPIGLLGVVRAFREGPRLAVAGAGVGGLVLGLLPYLYLFVADGPVSFGRVDRAADLLDFFLRRDYGGPAAFLPTATEAPRSANLLAFVQTLGRGWWWLPLAGGLAMLGYGCVRGRGESRVAWSLLAVSFAIAGPVIALRFNMPPEGLGLYVCQRFHLLPLLLLAIPVAAALDRVGELIAPRVPRRAYAYGVALPLLVVVVGVVAALPDLRGKHSPAMELGIRNLLRSLPQGAIVIVNSDDLCFGADYVQVATGERPDVVVACWIATSRPWYRDRLAARGLAITLPFEVEVTAAHADALLATGRPLFVDRSQKAILTQRPNHPYGTVIRILPQGAAVPGVREVVELNRTLYARFALDYPRPSRDADYAALAHKRYAITWVTLAAALDTIGDREASAAALELAEQLAPVQ